MNREKILAMKPGRELDALVAIKIMNFKCGTHLESSLIGWFRENGTFARNCFQPSTDISAAWEVIEKLKERYAVAVVSFKHAVLCEIQAPEMADPYDADFETAPEAICKAALLAVMEDKHDRR